jgi:2'-5' RNA ligase
MFLAVALDEPVRRLLAAFLDGADLPGRAVPPENWHLTLRFLGWTTGVQRDRILQALDDADLGSPFRIRFAGLGAFPKERRATVLWLGVRSGVEGLERLATAAEEAATATGFAPEERPFHPHLTLARVRPAVNVTDLVGRFPPFDVFMEVGAVTFFRSRLGHGGATYEVVDRVSL